MAQALSRPNLQTLLLQFFEELQTRTSNLWRKVRKSSITTLALQRLQKS